jgi:tetratricopeptide (TPR) repeat protein
MAANDQANADRSTPRVAVVAAATLLAGALGYWRGRAGAEAAAAPQEQAPGGSTAPERPSPAVAEWLRSFDRALSLSLRRLHLDLVEARLAATPLPAVEGEEPELAAALDEWALLRRRRRDAPGAEQLLALARRCDPDPQRARLRELSARGDPVELRELAKDPATASWPARSLELLGRALAAADAGDAALRVLERAIARHPGDFRLRLALADLLFFEGPPAAERARTHYGAAQALRPDSVRAAVRHGWLLADQAGEPSSAIAVLDAALRRFPAEPIAAYAFGVALFKARHVEEARQRLRDALDLDRASGRAPSAVSALALAALGEIALDQQELERAERSGRRSLEISDTPDARDVLGAALFLRGDPEAATRFQEESVRGHPDDALLRDHLAGSLVQIGRFQEALAHLKEAAHLDEWLAEVQNDYAWELVNSGDPSLRRPGKALEHTLRACELEPGNAWYRNTLGVTYYRLGEYEKCVAELEAASDMPRGGGPYDLFFLAMAKQQLGLHAEAVELFARASALMQEGNDELARLRAEAKALIEAQEGGGP